MTDIAVSSNYIVPDGNIELRFASGEAISRSGELDAVLVMPMTSSGTWTANTLYEITSQVQVNDGAGSRSPLAVAYNAAVSSGVNGKFYALPYTEPTGSAADGYVAFSGTATKSGSLNFVSGGLKLSAPILLDDTADDIGEKLEALIAQATGLPFIGANSTGTVTLTAAVNGTSQNGVHRFRCTVTSGIGITVAVSGDTLGTGFGNAGSGSDATNLETALSTIENEFFAYHGVHVFDGTSLAKVKTHLFNKAEPLMGLRGVGVAADVSAKSTQRATAIGVNFERVWIMGQPNGDVGPAFIVGNSIAVLQRRHQIDTTVSFAGYNAPPWIVPPVYDASNRLNKQDEQDLLADGVSAIGSTKSGSYISRLVTTKSKDSSGNNDDRRALFAEIIMGADEFCRRLITIWKNQYQGTKLVDDEFLPNGEINNLQGFVDGVTKPSTFRGSIIKLMKDMEEENKLQKVDELISRLVVRRDASNVNRVEALISLRVVNHFNQFTAIANEVTPG